MPLASSTGITKSTILLCCVEGTFRKPETWRLQRMIHCFLFFSTAFKVFFLLHVTSYYFQLMFSGNNWYVWKLDILHWVINIVGSYMIDKLVWNQIVTVSGWLFLPEKVRLLKIATFQKWQQTFVVLMGNLGTRTKLTIFCHKLSTEHVLFISLQRRNL